MDGVVWCFAIADVPAPAAQQDPVTRSASRQAQQDPVTRSASHQEHKARLPVAKGKIKES